MGPDRRGFKALLLSLVLALAGHIALAAVLAPQEVSLMRLTVASDSSRRSELPGAGSSSSCDGQRIAFVSNSDFLGEGLGQNKYIWLYRSGAMTFTRLTPRINSLDFSDLPSISADGAKVVFYSDNDFLRQGIVDGQNEIWMATADPVTVTRLTTSTINFSVNNRDPNLSADGTRVAFVGNWDFGNNQFFSGLDLWMLDLSNRQLARLLHAVPEGRRISEPDLSSDGTRVVFRSNADFFGQGIPDTSSRDIWLYDAATMTVTQITSDVINTRTSLWPSISGDGTQIAFVSSANFLNDGVAGSHLWLYDTAALTYTRVTSQPNWPTGVLVIVNPEISLDGRVIAFSSTYDHLLEQSSPRQEIWTYDISSRTFTRVTSSMSLPISGLLPNNLEASPNGDGTRVAFKSNVDFQEEGNIGFYEIWQAAITSTTSISPPLPLANRVFLPLVVRNAGGAAPIVWEEDDFDSLSIGPLAGQNGWFKAAPDRASAVVLLEPGGGKVLEFDPDPDQTIVMVKDVPDQTDGLHVVSLRVKVDAPHAGCAIFDSLAKLEVGTDPGNGWGKKFQVYFGSRTMRINYGPGLRDAVTIVPRTQLGHWYSIQVRLDLSTGRADVWVDGALAAQGVQVREGPIQGLGLSGWDLPGHVQIDDLRGTRE